MQPGQSAFAKITEDTLVRGTTPSFSRGCIGHVPWNATDEIGSMGQTLNSTGLSSFPKEELFMPDSS